MGNQGKFSRQRQWQEKRLAQGLCIQCGAEPLLTKNHGRKCAKRIREAARRRTSATRRYKNSKSYQTVLAKNIPAQRAGAKAGQ
jgi:hypothetical protein